MDDDIIIAIENEDHVRFLDNMIRIGICDDLREVLQIHKEMTARIMQRIGINAEIRCFLSGEELLCEIDQKGSMDILLMDMEMQGMNGVETARKIRNRDYSVILIFISLYDQYCKEMISVQPFAFIDKPVVEDQLERVLTKAIEVGNVRDEIFQYTYKKVVHKLPIREIRYLESRKREVIIHGTQENCSFYRKLDDIEQELNASNIKFIRVSKSYLTNTRYIKEFRYDKIIMNDGVELNIGPKYRNAVKEYYMEIMRKC